ncbi:uracil-DNA glycosylase [bacterium]|nr:uracil-DNA glycosylase [FCB group bacterium]MBL7190419.1 uracil-DNA glycosylase [bacterium]
MKCPLGKTRTNFVFGTGNPHADIVFIGEAPGRDEDLQGEPFVGRAGQLLNKMLPQYGLKRSDIYICNILKCRPPGNRDPLPLEIELCEPYLWKQLEIIKPQILVSLGRIAAQTLLKTDAPLAKLRNNMHQYRNTPFFITYHPAALLRNNSLIDSAYQDLAKIKEYYDKVKS